MLGRGGPLQGGLGRSVWPGYCLGKGKREEVEKGRGKGRWDGRESGRREEGRRERGG